MTIHFITGNAGKLREIQSLIPEVKSLDIDLVEIQHSDAQAIIEAKLNEASKQHNGALMVEDTSLYVDSMNGLPGPLIKWFMKSIGNEGILKSAIALGSVSAKAETIIGFLDEAGNVSFHTGTILGSIVEPRGENGFGWDAIFQPEGHDKTFAEMADNEKNQLSMRKLATANLKTFLDKA